MPTVDKSSMNNHKIQILHNMFNVFNHSENVATVCRACSYKTMLTPLTRDENEANWKDIFGGYLKRGPKIAELLQVWSFKLDIALFFPGLK